MSKFSTWVNYEPTKQQEVAYSAPEPFVLYGGATGGGKTTFLCAEVSRISLEHPGSCGYICRRDNSTFLQTTLRNLEEFFQPGMVRMHRRDYQYFELDNGSQIIYGGSDDVNLNRIKGVALNWFAIDEAQEVLEECYTTLRWRLRRSTPQVHFPYKGWMTSSNVDGWLEKMFITHKDEFHRFVPASITDNPYMPQEYANRILQMEGTQV